MTVYAIRGLLDSHLRPSRTSWPRVTPMEPAFWRWLWACLPARERSDSPGRPLYVVASSAYPRRPVRFLPLAAAGRPWTLLGQSAPGRPVVVRGCCLAGYYVRPGLTV